MVAAPPASRALEHADVLITAAMRAAAAWSVRDKDSRAWHEISRMAGVVQFVLGPGRPFNGPMELIRALREPLGELLGEEWDDPLCSVALLDSGGFVAREVHEWGSDYANALFPGGTDPGESWLPSWSWQRSEQVERACFDAMRRGTAEQYAATRRFLIEWPAGTEAHLAKARSAAGALPAASYAAVPHERTYTAGTTRWWWACPECRWPMRVTGGRVRCDISAHDADFDVAHGVPPALATRAARRRKAPGAQQAATTVCLPEPVWRFAVVPGIDELRLANRLNALPDVDVEMWPDYDRCDLVVRSKSHVWEVDVKDHIRTATIIRNPPSVRHLVVPDHRSSQVVPLRGALPSKHVDTMSAFVRLVRRATGGTA